MFKLLDHLKNYKKEVILGPIFKLLEAILELIVPLVMAKIIDVGVKSGNINYVIKMGLLMLLLGILGLVFALICQYFASKASQGFGTILRNKLFYHINSLSHSEIDTIGTPSLITRLTNDVNQLQVAVAMAIRLGTRAPFIIIGSAIMAMIINLKLSIIFLISIPLIVFVLYFVMSKSLPYYKQIQEKLDKVSLITMENLEGVRVVRAFSNQKKEKQRFNDSTNDLMNTSINVGRISALLNPMTFVIMNLSILAILWFGGIGVNNGNFTQGQIIAFVNYMTQILLTLIVVANLVIIFTKAYASGVRVNEIFDIKPTIKNGTLNKVPLTHSNVAISFNNVNFSYNNSSKNALEGISFTINKGEKVGIIGGTGSGKSTLINLVPRFYDATKGEVIINNENVKEYPLIDLRKRIGIVPQKAVLFTGTIRENMKWSDENATDEAIYKALGIAQCLDFINNLPEKLDTRILQGGKNFSGGQKQRLTIARALVSSPEILILDDSSSALDFTTEAKLRENLMNETNDMTMIVVSQRVTSIKDLDKILVLDDGILCSVGKHEELIDNCEVYKEICLSQLSEEEVNK